MHDDGKPIHQHTPQTVGAALRMERIKQHWTLKEVADKAGISVSYLSDVERGKTLPTLLTLGALAKAMGQTFTLVWREPGEEFVPLNPVEIELIYAVRDGDLRAALAMLYALTERK
jgi:transcriptional regulator with XRE-family HTH domain